MCSSFRAERIVRPHHLIHRPTQRGAPTGCLWRATTWNRQPVRRTVQWASNPPVDRSEERHQLSWGKGKNWRPPGDPGNPDTSFDAHRMVQLHRDRYMLITDHLPGARHNSYRTKTGRTKPKRVCETKNTMLDI